MLGHVSWAEAVATRAERRTLGSGRLLKGVWEFGGMAAGNFQVSAWTRGCRNLGDDILGLCLMYHWFLQGRESYATLIRPEGGVSMSSGHSMHYKNQ